jgi:hypothetical protein
MLCPWRIIWCITGRKVRVKQSRNRPGVAQRIPGGLGSQISWHSAREGGEVVSLTHRPPLPPRMFLVLIFTRGWVDPRAMERMEGDMSLKNPVTPPGTDPGTVRLVAQHLNHYSNPGPSGRKVHTINNNNTAILSILFFLCRYSPAPAYSASFWGFWIA